MKEYQVDFGETPFETEQLDKELRAAIGEDFQGVSSYGPGRAISVWIADEPVMSLDELATIIEGVAAAHVPAETKPKRQSLEDTIAELQARIAKLEGKKKNP